MNPTLIYDGECPVCLRAVTWAETNIGRETLTFLPCQDPERAERFPEMSHETCMEAMQLVMPDDRVLSGEQALPQLFAMAPRWRWVAWLFRVPGVSLLSPVLYRWIANHRYAISAVLLRKSRGETCDLDGDCS
jgi:predicted DCC family thiol-disulfide oxidoreductase YuxK